MKTLSIISQKGGVGKTTLATALAVAAEADGRNAALFDLDPQASATFWHDTRQSDSPTVVATPPARLPHLLKAASESDCDLAIIDAPPFAKDIAYEAASHADFILIPTKPAILDVMATTRTLELVHYYNKRAAILITFCPPAGREIQDTVDAVSELGAILCPIRIGNRIAYARAQQTGQVAQEIDPHGKAAREIKQLYQYMCIHINEDTHEPTEKTQFVASRS